jgi:hypothetical protein
MGCSKCSDMNVKFLKFQIGMGLFNELSSERPKRRRISKFFFFMKSSCCTWLPCRLTVLLNFHVTILLVDLIKLECDAKGRSMCDCLSAAGSPVTRQHCFWYHAKSLDWASARL